MISDNASIFKWKICREFCHQHRIYQQFTAPGFPQTNDLAERHVQSLKKPLESMEETQAPTEEKIRQILMHHHVIPLVSEKSLVKIYLRRFIRIKLDSIFPVKQEAHNTLKPKCTFLVSDRVQAQKQSTNLEIWYHSKSSWFTALHCETRL